MTLAPPPLSAPLDRWRDWIRPAVDAQLGRFVPERLDEAWIRRIVGETYVDTDLAVLQAVLIEPTRDALARGGKRWRPLCLALACAACGGDVRAALPYLPLPELIHNGTLMVDDVEDGSDSRRGGPAAHVAYGVDVAVNTGNFLYYLPVVAVLASIEGGVAGEDHVAHEVARLVHVELLRLHVGQALDIGWHSGGRHRPLEDDPRWRVTEGNYLTMCRLKTGTLVRLAMRLGALIAGAPTDLVDVLGRYGEALGVAFQIRDDLLNLDDAGQLGKAYGDDIAEGKLSLPALYALEELDREQAHRLVEILRSEATSREQVDEALGLIRGTGAVERAAGTARDLVDAAWTALRPHLAAGAGADRLRDLGEFALRRRH